ncbi:MAG TPA: reverse transcriptase-like protein [Candidatus Saccharimonadales bacterium]|nr:reverse transcriptase-like protein [Candidatus Saccharimonadales bacterium]
MKTLKFDHEQAELILSGQKRSTWRMFDDKDLSVTDQLKIIDKSNPDDPGGWKVIGQGTVTEVVEKLLKNITEQDMQSHEAFGSREEILEHYRGYYGRRVTMDTPVKMVYFDFKPTNGDTPSQAMLLDEAKLYTDGGSRGNPGQSACAFVICKLDDSVVEKSGYYMGVATNNQAEYQGMIKGLERCQDLGIDKIRLFSDSQLVVNQMNGFYKVKNQELAPLHQQLKELADSFEKISFQYVPRALNATADKEVNRILDDQERHQKK